MTARRLLLAAGGGSSFIIPESAASFQLFAAPDGGWTWFTDPRALSHNGYTYIGYINDVGDVCVRAVEEATLTASAEVVLHAALEVDDHDNPGLWIRPSDNRLVCFYSAHLAANYYKRVSTTSLDTDPTLSYGFDAEVNLDSAIGGTLYTYANPVSLNDADGDGLDSLWLFFRNHVGGSPRWYYARSDDGGSTFAPVDLHHVTYSRVVSDGIGRIDVAVATHPSGGDDPDTAKVSHLYRENAAWRGSSGSSLGATPIARASMTTVYDSGGDPTWIWDIAYGASGEPIIAFTVFPSDTDHRYWYARWNGSSWDTTEIVAGGTYLPTAGVGMAPIEEFYSGGMALDHSDPNIVYCSVGVGSDQWEMRRYVTADDGATFSGTVIATSGKHARPASVRNHTDAIKVVWWNGTYTSYVDYDVATMGYGS